MRAELIRELSGFAPLEELALLLPEDQGGLQDSLALINLDLEQLLSDLQGVGREADGLRSITFAVSAEDEALIEEAVSRAKTGLEGKNLRGRALTEIASRFLGGGQG